VDDKLKYYFNAGDLEEETVEGTVKRCIFTAENIQTVIYNFPPDKVFPPHKHDDCEQMGYLVSGKMGFRVGGVEKILLPGDFYLAPIGVEHNAWTLEEPSVLLDFFVPPREDLKR